MNSKHARFGPGALVAAAFIGPGTVTVCTLAGVSDGLSLLWAMLIAIFICYVLQEMAARIGLVTRKGLTEALRSEIRDPITRTVMLGIILAAIVIGNAAYEAGNISGGALGLQTLFGVANFSIMGVDLRPFTILISVLAAVVLYIGSYYIIEKLLISLVTLMSIAFALAAVATKPELSELIAGLVPRPRPAQTLTIMALIGTTVVPYNLFLHARTVQEKWADAQALPQMRRDAAWTIGIGGLISMTIIITAAAMQGSAVTDAAQLARSLEPVFGMFSRYILAIGLFAAGITSAITAPLAAVYVTNGAAGWRQDLRAGHSRAVWLAVLLTGTAFSVVGGSPIEIIRFAQVANGILLPLMVAFLLWAANRSSLMGDHTNTRRRNLFGFAVLIFATALSLRSLWTVISALR